MQGFTIGEAWSQTMAYLALHWRTLLVILGATTIAGTLVQVLLLGGSPDAMAEAMVAQMAAGGGDVVSAGQALGPLVGGAGFLGAVIGMVGQFVALRTTLSSEAPGSAVGYAVAAALLTILLYFAAAIVVVLVFALILGVFGVGLLGMGASGSGAAAGFAGILVILVLLILPVLLWVAARFSVSAPAMADARSANPLFGLAASWRLTAQSQWAIFLYLVVLIIAGIVLFALLGIVVGIVSMLLGPTVGPILSSIVIGIAQMILTVAVSVGIYRALVPNDSRDVFA